jgi:hypothetical protein
LGVSKLSEDQDLVGSLPLEQVIEDEAEAF